MRHPRIPAISTPVRPYYRYHSIPTMLHGAHQSSNGLFSLRTPTPNIHRTSIWTWWVRWQELRKNAARNAPGIGTENMVIGTVALWTSRHISCSKTVRGKEVGGGSWAPLHCCTKCSLTVAYSLHTIQDDTDLWHITVNKFLFVGAILEMCWKYRL